MIKYSQNGCKLLLILIVFAIIVMSGYYEYMLNVTIYSSKYSSYLGLNFTANSYINTDVGKLEIMQTQQKTKNVTKSQCPHIPTGLTGQIKIAVNVPSMEQLQKEYSHIQQGGEMSPDNCVSNTNVAIIIPYRNRMGQLRVFLNHMHKFLSRQELHYRIYIINQADTNVFNRGMIINVGFTEAMKDFQWDCFIFHDVDLLPEDDRNLYNCPEKPRHMSVAVDKFNYKLPYKEIFGGVVAISTNLFRELNGFSNLFWGWGGEDDDMAVRIKKQKLKVERYDKSIARYTMIRHRGEEVNKIRMFLLKSSDKRRKDDGLKDLNYEHVNTTKERLYTNITVKLELPKKFADLEKEAAIAAKKEKEEKEKKKALKEAQKKENIKNLTPAQNFTLQVLGTTITKLYNQTFSKSLKENKTVVISNSEKNASIPVPVTKKVETEWIRIPPQNGTNDS